MAFKPSHDNIPMGVDLAIISFVLGGSRDIPKIKMKTIKKFTDCISYVVQLISMISGVWLYPSQVLLF